MSYFIMSFFIKGWISGKWPFEMQILPNYQYAYTNWILSVIFGELVIPSIIVVIFTALIIVKLMKVKERRLSIREQQGKRSKAKKDNQATIALLAVSIAFVTLRTPYIFTYSLLTTRNQVLPNMTDWQELHLEGAVNIAFILAVTNYAINFLLYIITGKTFRDEFRQFLLGKLNLVSGCSAQCLRPFQSDI